MPRVERNANRTSSTASAVQPSGRIPAASIQSGGLVSGVNHESVVAKIATQLKKKIDSQLWLHDYMKRCPAVLDVLLPEPILQAMEKSNVSEVQIEENKSNRKPQLVFKSTDFTPDGYDHKLYNDCDFSSPGLYVCGKYTATGNNNHAIECLIVEPTRESRLAAEHSLHQGDAMHEENSRGKCSSAEETPATAFAPASVSESDFLSTDRIENTAWQDFSTHTYTLPVQPISFQPIVVQKPQSTQQSTSAPTEMDLLAFRSFVEPLFFGYLASSPPWKKLYVDLHWEGMALAGIDALLYRFVKELSSSPDNLSAFLNSVQVPMVRTLSDTEKEQMIVDTGTTDADSVLDILRTYYDDDALFVAWLFGVSGVVDDEVRRELVNSLAVKWHMSKGIIEHCYLTHEKAGSDSYTVTPPDYPFELYEPDSYNLGLRMVYRQTWRPLGTQRGEVVRSIPLGPRQVERITTKVTSRVKREHAYEETRSEERTTDRSESTKDSTEIIAEAAKSFKFSMDTTASVNVGVFSGKSTVGIDASAAKKSQETSSSLSETMQKTATKTRNETKVQVKTESETTTSEERFTEIQNPNDEIAVTYFYSNLQRQYEILTRLAEVESVVFIAETVPSSINCTLGDWIRENDWIISKVLLDESFREGLNLICQDDQGPENLDSDVASMISDVMEKAKTSLPDLAKNQGAISRIDVISEAQKAYRQVNEVEAGKKQQRQMVSNKKRRFIDHVRRNLLHYCRAVWSYEDPEQRMLRYRKQGISIPTVWRLSLERNLTRYHHGIHGPVVNAFTGTHRIGGLRSSIPFIQKIRLAVRWVPDLSDPSTIRPVSELVECPAPIGFAGNYAVFHIRADAFTTSGTGKAFPMLQTMLEPYSDEEGLFRDPALNLIEIGKENSISELSDHERQNIILSVPELKVVFEAATAAEKREIVRTLHTLENIRSYYCRYFCGQIADETKLNIIYTLPSLRTKYESLADSARSGFLRDLQVDEGLYREYLFRRKNMRRLVVDTNNLVVDIIPGTGTTLEWFKLRHREFDVEKAREETRKLALENTRRSELIRTGSLHDPEIEKTIILGCGDTGGIVRTILGTGTSSGDTGDNG